MSQTAHQATFVADFGPAIRSLEKGHRALQRGFVAVSVYAASIHYGAPCRVSEETAWADVGTDLCRILLIDEMERRWRVDLADEDREGIQTVGDLIDLLVARAAAPWGG